MTETEQQDTQALCENWETMRPIIAEVQRRTGLNRMETMMLWIVTALMDGDEPEPWQA